MSSARMTSHSTLAADMADIPPRAKVDMRDTVREGVKVGNTVAKDFARVSSGQTGKLYPRSFSSQMNRGGGLFGNVISGEYGPVSASPQGGMSFEFGSRNQKPHLDLNRSADLIGPSFAQEVSRLPDKWFW
jgi:hypothetical protein